MATHISLEQAAKMLLSYLFQRLQRLFKGSHRNIELFSKGLIYCRAFFKRAFFGFYENHFQRCSKVLQNFLCMIPEISRFVKKNFHVKTRYRDFLKAFYRFSYCRVFLKRSEKLFRFSKVQESFKRFSKMEESLKRFSLHDPRIF